MKRRKRMLFVLTPLLLGLGFYNFTFFRDRANRTSGLSTVSATKPTVQPAPTVAEAVAMIAEEHPATTGTLADRPPPRSYEEGILRLSPRPSVVARFALSSGPAPRDIFTHRLVAAAPANGADAPVGGNHGAVLGSTESGPAEKIPIPLRVDGWVRTPETEYAIVNGSLAKSGTQLPTDERVLKVTRGGVTVSTGQGVQVLPLFGEEPNKVLNRTVRSVR